MNNKLIINFFEKCVFYAFVFLIPLQTRKIFYIFSEGDFNEWLSVSLYATDILVLLLFIFGIRRIIAGGGKIKLTGADYFLFAFFVWSGIGVFFAANFYLAVYRWIKLAEMIFVFFYTRQFLTQHQKSGLISIVWIWIFSAFTQSIIAIAQFFKQSDLGLRIFHESPIGALIDGVAKIDIGGLKIVRAYGLFPHPNILAAFLGTAIFSCLWLLIYGALNKKTFSILMGALLTIFTGLILTFSRSAIILVVGLSFLFLCSAYFSGKEFFKKKKILEISVILFFFAVILFLLFQPLILSRFDVSISEQAVNLRNLYNKVALDFIKKSPIFGVGIGNFVYEFKLNFGDMGLWQYQPAHNLYLLIVAETGIFGLVLFLGFIVFLLRNIFLVRHVNNNEDRIRIFYFPTLRVVTRMMIFSIFYFLFLGFIDHYFWTLQQGMLMMWVVFGAIESILMQKFNS